MKWFLATPTGAAAGHAAIAGTTAGHDGSASGAGWGVAHIVHGLHRVRDVVNAAVLDRVWICAGGLEAAAGCEVRCDSLLGWCAVIEMALLKDGHRFGGRQILHV